MLGGLVRLAPLPWLPALGTDPADIVLPSLAGISMDAFRRLGGALEPTLTCCHHCVPGTPIRPRKGGKVGPRCDCLAAGLHAGERESDAASRVTMYRLLYLFASEERLRYPPKSYADLVACGDVLEHLLAVFSPGGPAGRAARAILERTYDIDPAKWAGAHRLLVCRRREVPSAHILSPTPGLRWPSHSPFRCVDWPGGAPPGAASPDRGGQRWDGLQQGRVRAVRHDPPVLP